MTPRTHKALRASLLDDKIDILNRDADEASSAKQVFRTVSATLTLVRDKLIDDEDSVQLSEYCFNVCEALKTVTQGRNADNESVGLALKDLERVTEEIERTLRRGANTQRIKQKKGKVEGQKLKIQEILNTLNAPNVALDATMASGSTATYGSGGASRRLVRRAFALHELPSLIEVIFSSKDETDTIRRLLGDDAQAFIDVIDEALDGSDISPRTRKNCLKSLYRSCGRNALLPTTLRVPTSYNRTGGALYKGGFADVWKGKYLGRDVAVKVIRMYSNTDLQKIIGRFCKEVVTWKALQHPNILPLIGVTMSETEFEMVSDWMVNGNINDFVRAHPDANRLELLGGVARGLIYIHSQGMIHGDLKGANVLIDETGRALLADFGLLTIISDPTNFLSSSSYTQAGTNRWMSPERIAPHMFGFKDARPTKPSDCYALGMVIYETISGNFPFHKDADITVSFKVVDGKRPPRGTSFTNSLWKMLELCWVPQPDDRLGIEDVIRCLEEASNSPELPSPGECDGIDDDGTDESEDDSGMDEDDWDPRTSSPGVPNGTSDTTTGMSVAVPFGPGFPTDRSPSPVSAAPVPPTVEAVSDSDADSLDRETMNPSMAPIDSNGGGTYQVPLRTVPEAVRGIGRLGFDVQTPNHYQSSSGQDPPQPPPTQPSVGLIDTGRFRLQLNNLLQETAGAGRLRWGDPIRGGPDDRPRWEISAFLDGLDYGTATGGTLYAAKEEAARQVLRRLLPNFGY